MARTGPTTSTTTRTDPAHLGRGPDKEEELRVSTLELFFDLVFVFTLTQLTSVLVGETSLVSGVDVFLMFIVLFWMYGGYVWLTNQVLPAQTMHRLLLIAGMAAFFVCALAIPRAFTGGGLVFGTGYLLVVLVHAGLYAQVYGRAVLRFVPFNVLGAACLIAAGLVDRPAAYALWVAPIVLQYLASAFARTVDERSRAGFDVRPAHFVERHGGLLIIAFGESIAAVGIGLGDLALDAPTIVTAVLGLLLVALLWWAYFADDPRRAETSLAAASLDARVRMALAPALLLAGGVAVYLCGDLAFRRALCIPMGRFPLAGALVALATAGLGLVVDGLAELLGLLVTLVAMLLAERLLDGPAQHLLPTPGSGVCHGSLRLCGAGQLVGAPAPGHAGDLGDVAPLAGRLAAHLRAMAESNREGAALAAPGCAETAPPGSDLAGAPPARPGLLGPVRCWLDRAAPLCGPARRG